MELLLIRHAEPVRIGPGTAAGPADPHLTGRGRAQADRLAAWLAADPIEKLLSSPLRRARETAEPVARTLGLDVEVVDGLMEYDARSDFYIPVEELRETRDHHWTAMIEGRWDELGGEPPDQFRARIVPCVDAIIERFPGGTVAAVCHGGVINVYLAALLGLERHLWFHPEYTSISRIAAARTGERSVVSLNDTAHLVATRDAREDPA
ncbi:MAG TPA: histidine phosphatase family protein [Acidimicrobiia bacterium]|nr:histidine phosphatase family protein [Acidimicrobiia bacterium]